jgi:NADPH-dependent glutamate synthase beta subunit-like oxidoreductase
VRVDKPFAITLDPGSSLANRTGSWRTMRPVYVDRLPPCNHACPAGENIQQWLFHAEGGDYEAAWRQLVEDNPLPATMGRVCYHPCESACNRAQLDEAVGINSVERFLGDEALKRHWKFAPPADDSGKRVLVVGAGPSGLSAAYHLRRLGHAVTMVEAGPFAGGMMRFGIPAYRLPRDVLDAEVRRILDLGVELRLNSKVANILDAMREGRFDAAFLAVGAHIGKRAYIPAGEAARMLDAVSVLRSMEGEDKPMLGRRVVVYGGGNTALDVARTAKRMGAEPIIVYRRTREKMPAHDSEVEEALAEGVLIKWLSTIRNVEGTGTLTVEKMALDRRGRNAGSRLAGAGTRPGRGPVAARGRAGTRDQGRHRSGRAEHDDRPRRHLRRRRHGAVGTDGDRRGGPRQEGRAAHRCLAAGPGRGSGGQASAGFGRPPESLVLQRCAEDGAAAARRRSPHLDLRGSPEGPDGIQRAVRGAPLPVVRQLLRV